MHLQVRSHAVEVLQRTEDEELLYYLLQLVQALRYEAKTHSRLSNFLIARATKNPVMGTLLHWSAFPVLCLSVNDGVLHGDVPAVSVRARGVYVGICWPAGLSNAASERLAALVSCLALGLRHVMH